MDRERALYALDCDLHPLEAANARECIRVLKNIIAPRNERATGCSALHILWDIALSEQVPPEVEQGFIEEFMHLFKGANGHSGIYAGQEPPAYLQLTGQEASIRRSDDLDE